MLQVGSNDWCDSAHGPSLKAFQGTPLPGTISGNISDWHKGFSPGNLSGNALGIFKAPAIEKKLASILICKNKLTRVKSVWRFLRKEPEQQNISAILGPSSLTFVIEKVPSELWFPLTSARLWSGCHLSGIIARRINTIIHYVLPQGKAALCTHADAGGQQRWFPIFCRHKRVLLRFTTVDRTPTPTAVGTDRSAAPGTDVRPPPPPILSDSLTHVFNLLVSEHRGSKVASHFLNWIKSHFIWISRNICRMKSRTRPLPGRSWHTCRIAHIAQGYKSQTFSVSRMDGRSSGAGGQRKRGGAEMRSRCGHAGHCWHTQGPFWDLEMRLDLVSCATWTHSGTCAWWSGDDHVTGTGSDDSNGMESKVIEDQM